MIMMIFRNVLDLIVFNSRMTDDTDGSVQCTMYSELRLYSRDEIKPNWPNEPKSPVQTNLNSLPKIAL